MYLKGIVLGITLTACGLLHAAELPRIAVSNYPLQWVTETLVGDQATVINLTQNAENPREWVPDDQGLAHLESADLIILQGGGYEPWAAGMDWDNLFRSSEAIFERYSEARKLSETGKALFYGNVQGRAWLDPLHLQFQAEAIADHLHTSFPELNLQKGNEQIKTELAEVTTLYRSHPRLQKERILALDAALELTLRSPTAWKIQTVGSQDPSSEVWNSLDLKSLKAQMPQIYEYFPARLAVTLHTPDPKMVRLLQRQYRIHLFSFNPGETPPLRERSYPEIMETNFKTLTSGYLTP